MLKWTTPSVCVTSGRPQQSGQDFFLLADPSNIVGAKLESYSLLSRQILPNEKPIDEIVLVPCISKALVLSGMSSR